MDLMGKTVVILGAQRTGTALARLVVRLQGKAKISEKRPADCVPAEFKEWASQHHVDLEFGGHTSSFVQESDVVVLSPAVPIHSTPVEWARARNIPVLGEIEFAAQFCSKPIIAVTGSNGKTTVSTLISQVIRAAGYGVCLCGNIGSPFSDYVLDLEDKDFVVLEISSFQLESLLAPGSPFRQTDVNGRGWVKGFKPYIGLILNFSQNHLDRHKDLQEYFDAKKKIFLNQDAGDFAVLNAADSYLKNLAAELKSHVSYFDPSHPAPPGIEDNPNFLAVLEVGRILGISEQTCAEVFRRFTGVEHRLERVRQLNGVHFINDSKATTAEAATWALRRVEAPIVMICGGRDKNIDFRVVRDLVKQKVRKMFVIGEARAKLKAAFADLIDVEECGTLEEAVGKAQGEARGGTSVLLSPMCASFDMFKDYEERGRVFKEIVRGLKETHA